MGFDSRRAPRQFNMIISRHTRILLALLSVLILSAAPSNAQQPSPNGAADCGESSNTLRKRNGKVVWFSPKQMNAMAINRAAPPFPSMCSCQGAVVVALVVNSEGNVACGRVISGHPLLRAASIQAANKWTFKPRVKRGAKASFVGLLVFTFHSDGAVTY